VFSTFMHSQKLEKLDSHRKLEQKKFEQCEQAEKLDVAAQQMQVHLIVDEMEVLK